MPTKQSYPYALTGGAMLLLALAAVAGAYMAPFGDVLIQGDFTFVHAEYDAFGVDVTTQDDQESASYRDKDADVPTEFKTGFWLTPIGGFLILAAAILLFAAPSGGVRMARIGAGVGFTGSLVVMIAAIAFLLGFSDLQDTVQEVIDAGGEASSGLRAGAIWLGAAVVLGMGGSFLGLSDKPVAAAKPAARACGHCSKTVPRGQAFCGGCGASVA